MSILGILIVKIAGSFNRDMIERSRGRQEPDPALAREKEIVICFHGGKSVQLGAGIDRNPRIEAATGGVERYPCGRWSRPTIPHRGLSTINSPM